MKRSILLSVLVIGAVAALVSAGSWALFDDTETSNGNIVSTGSLNLMVGKTLGGPPVQCQFNDPWSGPLLSLTDAAPGASAEVTICLMNIGSLNGNLSAELTVTDTEVGDCMEPEFSAGDTTCTDGAQGELGQYVQVVVWKDTDCDNELDSGEDVWFNDTANHAPTTIAPTPFAHGAFMCVGVEATVNASAGNEAQTDKVEADVTFTLAQQ